MNRHQRRAAARTTRRRSKFTSMSDEAQRTLGAIIHLILTQSDLGKRLMAFMADHDEFGVFCAIVELMDAGLAIIEMINEVGGENGYRLTLTPAGLKYFEDRGVTWGTA